ncbi:hypothetical protein [Agromyces flavus]|nr:hypothetical protein [Agromyces flavus]GGI48359.1 hypothetical protein GCM10010932_30470 [Agromyces flavus]SDS40194.1 hypothetical protein SAMN04489721_1260 [Agromyces flavus]
MVVAGVAIALVLTTTACGPSSPGAPAGGGSSSSGGSSDADAGGGGTAGGGTDGGTDGDGSGGGTENGDAGGGANPVSYRWALPTTNTGVSGNDGPAYGALQRSCDEGQAFLDDRASEGYGFRSPRNVVMFVAAIAVCRGDLDTARIYATHAVAEYGLGGLYNPEILPPCDPAFCDPDSAPECEVYRSVMSVLDQAPRENYDCPGGSPPEDRISTDANGVVWIDDPVTLDIDESDHADVPPSSSPPTADPPEDGEGGATDAPDATSDAPPGAGAE